MRVYSCRGVQSPGVQTCQPEGLLGGVDGGPRHHDLGDSCLPGPLYHLVQVTAELLVGEVGTNVNNNVVRQLIQHCLRGSLSLVDIIVRIFITNPKTTWVSCSNALSLTPEVAMVCNIKSIIDYVDIPQSY